MDPGESDWLTALRETKEEAGLSEHDLEVISYSLIELQNLLSYFMFPNYVEL